MQDRVVEVEAWNAQWEQAYQQLEAKNVEIQEEVNDNNSNEVKALETEIQSMSGTICEL